ncbi:MAG: prolipoprotein diacylglyceryl transferase [Candidatus Sumerlaeaceae bacterium]|jgi:phosphatidylglycerol:prolipoprotein diacylglycerol transferase
MHPIILRIGSFAIPTYGVLVACGILAGTWLASRLARRVNLSLDFVLDAVFWCVVAGLGGARLTYVALEWRSFVADPLATLFASGGQVFLGGFLTAIVALVWVARRYRVRLPLAADVLAPALALGHAFGRVGCYFAGCCYGAPTEGSWGVRFPQLLDEQGRIVGSFAYLDHLAQGLIAPTDTCSLPVYPVQLFEALGNLVLCGALLLLWRRRRFEGHVALAYVFAYSFMRFVLEFLRGDAIRGILFGLSTSQWLSLFVAIAAIFVWRRLNRASVATGNSLCNFPPPGP